MFVGQAGRIAPEGAGTNMWGKTMKRVLLAGVSLAAMGLINGAYAADTYPPLIRGTNICDPYKDYTCLDAYLGTDFMSRFINYYRLEWGHDVAPSDPKAPPARRSTAARSARPG